MLEPRKSGPRQVHQALAMQTVHTVQRKRTGMILQALDNQPRFLATVAL